MKQKEKYTYDWYDGSFVPILKHFLWGVYYSISGSIVVVVGLLVKSRSWEHVLNIKWEILSLVFSWLIPFFSGIGVLIAVKNYIRYLAWKEDNEDNA